MNKHATKPEILGLNPFSESRYAAWNAARGLTDGELRAIAEQFGPDEVGQEVRVCVAISLAYAVYMGQLRDWPEAWCDIIDECLEDRYAEDARGDDDDTEAGDASAG